MTDTTYEKARNKLIPQAVRYANKTEGLHPAYKQEKDDWSCVWNLAFLGEMNRLAKYLHTSEEVA